MNKNAELLLKERYCRPGEAPQDVYKRVAKVVSLKDKKFEDHLYKMMENGTVMFSSPILRNAGHKKNRTLHACYVLPITDSMHGILGTLNTAGEITRAGGGFGVDFTPLRPRGSVLSGGGEASGPVSFMELFDVLLNVIRQGGWRRGAAMFALGHDHPDAVDFVRAKLTGRLQNANLSLIVTDDFMDVGKRKWQNLLDLAAFGAWQNGDPGLLFYNTMNAGYPLKDKPVRATNPCGEVPLSPNAACCLGSVNLSAFVNGNEFNFQEFGKACQDMALALLNVDLLSHYPEKEIQYFMTQHLPIGVGVMGYADALIMLGIKYDSPDALTFIDKVGKVYKASTDEIAGDSIMKRSIAPTGSLSILAGCSPSIEPLFGREFVRNISIGPILESKDIYSSKYAVTAHEIDPEDHLKTQAQWQKWVDGGVSKTVNLPYDSTVDEVKSIFRMAYKMKVKGITVYRDGSHDGQVIRVKRQKCEDGECHL